MDSTLITRRLHISGLTSALTPTDLSQRLSLFGTVKALDGFGLLNGVNQTRTFAFVTLETTAGKLAKCLNALSGSTWKGTTLRIGEAKPDFRERLARERDEAVTEPPRKKRRRAHGVEAADMSLVTPENVSLRSGWRVTPLGRMLRPMRMRPLRPLAEVVDVKRAKEKKLMVKIVGEGKEKESRRKRRVKNAPTRMRRRTIDPPRWGSVHLKGMFLDVEVIPKLAGSAAEMAKQEQESGSGGGEMSDGGLQTIHPVAPAKRTNSTDVVTSPSPTVPSTPLPYERADISLEKNRSMILLKSLFGTEADAEWGGMESVESDVDEEPVHRNSTELGRQLDVGEDLMDVDGTNEMVGTKKTNARPELTKPLDEKSQEPQLKLKDLFAPREETGGFSLLDHLGLDLELDDDIAISNSTGQPPSAPSTLPFNPNVQTTLASAQPSRDAHLEVDPRNPLFFPATSTKGRTKDVYDIAKENGWHWRDPAVGFWRTETEESIRKRWEGQKVELTRAWKKRWREAGKNRKRKGGDGD